MANVCPEAALSDGMLLLLCHSVIVLAAAFFLNLNCHFLKKIQVGQYRFESAHHTWLDIGIKLHSYPVVLFASAYLDRPLLLGSVADLILLEFYHHRSFHKTSAVP